jgi:hypothetical protein
MRQLMIRLFIFLFIPLTCSSASASSITVSDQVSGNWSADTVFVTGNLIVPENEILTIQPGTRIEFESYYRLDVMGCMHALGESGDSILFTIRDTSNFYSQTSGRGGWSGIRFLNNSPTNDSSIFTFCRFEFSKAAEDSANCYGGAIQLIKFGKVRFSGCLFYHNYSFYSGGAIYLRYADARIENCTFTGNYSGNTSTVYGYGGAICSMYSSPEVNSNSFYSNSSTGVGGAVSFDYSDPVFNNNRMMNNFSALGGAFGVLRSSPTQTMANNLVANNSSLFFGGGVCCIRSFPVFSNLTICGNSSAYGGGFYCNDSAVPNMYNSIIYNNSGFGTSVYIWDIFSSPGFYYCNIEGDTSGFEGSGGHEGYHGEYINNINLEPSFYENGPHPFQLISGSPCIDSGSPDTAALNLPASDISGGPRIYNDRIDMGAYEYNGTTGTRKFKDESITRNVTAFPNPFSDHITFRLPFTNTHPVTCQVIDQLGNIAAFFTIPAGSAEYTWDTHTPVETVIAAGVYLVSCTEKMLAFPLILKQ